MEIEVNGITLYFEKSGPKAASDPALDAGVADTPARQIVLVHGNGEDHHIFDELAVALAPTFEVYALDSRGHGQSTPVDTISYDDMATDVIDLCDKLELNHPALFGFSDGGIIGLLVAIRAPHLLSRLAVAGANMTPDGLKARFSFLMHLEYLFTRDPGEKARIKMMLDEPQITPEQLAGIEVPTLVLAGSKDVIREGHTRQIAAAIPGAELHIVPGEGHSSYVKHSLKALEYLGPFLGM